jgi:xanthine/CO dehydrogenase XdhC/CoxF family maturation factor
MPSLRLDTSLELLIGRLTALTEPAVLATLVATEGSTYQKSGARMLIESSGRLTGLLSGGCCERDLAKHAEAVIGSGDPRIVEYDLRTADDLLYGIGAGCEGAMRVLLERVSPEGLLLKKLVQAVEQLADGHSVALAIIHDGPTATLGTHAAPSGDAEIDEVLAQILAEGRSRSMSLPGGRRAYGEFLAPPPRILICGAAPVGLDIGALTPEAGALSIAAELHALASGRLATIAGTCDDVP